MGMCLHAIATKEDVRRVVVIEIDPEVIQLMSQSTDFDDWSCRNKITVLQADALAAETAKHVEEAFAGETIDYFYADIWPVFPAPEAPAQTGIMCELYKPAHAGWWGQEVEYGLWNEDSGQPVSIENMTEFFMQTGVKASLIPGYVSFCEAAISAQLGYEGPTPLSLGII
jgi:hypothetical protein